MARMLHLVGLAGMVGYGLFAVLLALAGASVALVVRAVALLRRPTAAPRPTPARSAPARR